MILPSQNNEYLNNQKLYFNLLEDHIIFILIFSFIDAKKNINETDYSAIIKHSIRGVINMFGKKCSLTLLFAFLIVVILLLCSCSGLVKVSIQINNEHTGTIIFSLFNSEGQGIKIYSDIVLESGGSKKITLDSAEGYYMNFFTTIEALNYIWNEEIGGVETHDIPWVSGKTYHIGDPSIGEWQLIM